jgi:hypothetical protein
MKEETMGAERCEYGGEVKCSQLLVPKPEGKCLFGRLGHTLKYVKINLREIWREGLVLSHLAER